MQLVNGLMWVAVSRANFWGMHVFAIIVIVALIVYIPNEIALAIVAINAIYFFVITLGSPLWVSKKKTMFPPLYGSFCNSHFFLTFLALLESGAMATQIITSPLFLLSQFSLLFVPGTLFNLKDQSQDSLIALFQPIAKKIISEYFPLIVNNVIEFDSGKFIENFSLFETLNHFVFYFWACIDFIKEAMFMFTRDLPGYFWGVQLFWCLVVFASWHMTSKLKRKYFKLFQPIGKQTILIFFSFF
jgi:hypothetical protein